MGTLKLIVNFRNGIPNGYNGQLVKEVECTEKEDVYFLIQDAQKFENDGDVKTATVQHLDADGKYLGNLKFWETDYVCQDDVSDNILSDFDYQ